MIKLKHVIHYADTNSVEATWVDETTPAIEVPETAAPDTISEEGEVVPGAVTPAHTIPAVEVQVKCHSYADVQMDMLRADLAKHGGTVSEHSALIALVESRIKPSTPPTAEELAADARIVKDADDTAEAKGYAKLTALKGMTPAQIQTWATANVTTLAQARDAITTLAIAVSILARRL